MSSYFITGSSRGLGLAFAEELVRTPFHCLSKRSNPQQLKDPQNFVIATARSPFTSKGLQELTMKHKKDKLAILTLDILDSASIRAAAKEAEALLPNGIDYLINNAAVTYDPATSFDDLYALSVFRSRAVRNSRMPLTVI
jgi:NAD(P)-dependent dehydrogenase (short-subunit alcohol dehydrogenase family)